MKIFLTSLLDFHYIKLKNVRSVEALKKENNDLLDDVSLQFTILGLKLTPRRSASDNLEKLSKTFPL